MKLGGERRVGRGWLTLGMGMASSSAVSPRSSIKFLMRIERSATSLSKIIS